MPEMELVEAHVVVGTLVIVVARRGWTRPALLAVQQRTSAALGAPVEIMTERQWYARVDLVRRPAETDEQYLRRLAAESGEEGSQLELASHKVDGKMMTRAPISDAIERLLERLQTGWAPKADEIDRDVPQVDALNWGWNFEDSETIVPLGITYQTAERDMRKTGPVLHIDAHRTYALTAEGIFWLYDSEESEKVRHLGG
jgi:hypothetical protein